MLYKFCKVLLLNAFILTFIFSLSCTDRKSKAVDYVKDGFSKLAVSDINGAKKDADRAIKLYPKLPEAWFLRGNVFFNLRLLDSALNNYSIAITLKPDYGEAYSNRAKVKSILGLPTCYDWLKAEEYGV
ncbi:MAG TPA: hypothetical protein P5250_06200, partial [Bacteroidales bacterium]|nr:hypothetical protein [Bacteroidales bacterium]